jgi:hypothetical protein
VTWELSALHSFSNYTNVLTKHFRDWLVRPRANFCLHEADEVGLHQLCDKGDRRACVRFGMMLGEAKERHSEWRKAHAEWWWWEH